MWNGLTKTQFQFQLENFKFEVYSHKTPCTLLTDEQRVVVLPTQAGYVLLRAKW